MLNESDTTSGPLLSAVVKRLTSSKLPNIPTTQNLNEKYPKYLTKSDEFVPKTDPVSSVFNGDNVFAHGKALGGLKEDFTKADILGNDSVRRILDFDKTSTSFQPVGDKKLTSGTSETSVVTNVQRCVIVNFILSVFAYIRIYMYVCMCSCVFVVVVSFNYHICALIINFFLKPEIPVDWHSAL